MKKSWIIMIENELQKQKGVRIMFWRKDDSFGQTSGGGFGQGSGKGFGRGAGFGGGAGRGRGGCGREMSGFGCKGGGRGSGWGQGKCKGWGRGGAQGKQGWNWFGWLKKER